MSFFNKNKINKKPLSKTYDGNNLYKGRVLLFIFAIFILFGLIGYRLFNLTFINHENFVKIAQLQYRNPSTLSSRGSIYFTDQSSPGLNSKNDVSKNIVATNRPSIYLYSNNKTLYASSPDPAKINEIAAKLASILNLKPEIIQTNFSQKDKTYQVLAAGITVDQERKIKNLKISGISTTTQIERFYSLGETGGQMLGFVGFSDNNRVGQYGIESYYNDILSGESSSSVMADTKSIFSKIKDLFGIFNKGKSVNVSQNPAPAPTDSQGKDIVLTIDKNIQALAETKLEAVLKKWSSYSGTIIVEDPRNGEILAMASSPSFDPNKYSDYDLGNFLNPAVQQIYEPGSSFKPITMSGAIDTGAVTPETTYLDSGSVQIADRVIKDFDEKAHGIQTMREVLEHSLNIGAVFAEQKMGDDPFLNYVVAFGFGQKTGIDLSGEISGNISNLYTGRQVNFATASFGQGIAVTPIQLVNAYSAIANDGKLMWPHLLKEIINRDGTTTPTKPKIISSPITEESAKVLRSMLVDVVDKGFDKARITGYYIAGKTGTAQIPGPSGGYLGNDQFIHNFVGFAPADNPRFTVLIKIDKPKGIKFASDSLSPVFGEIARYLIRYFNIPPTR